MIEFFVIFSKSGIVIFEVNKAYNHVINGLIKHVFLEERTGQYQTDQLKLNYLIDNEFELIYVVGYQKLLQLSYVDKFLDDIQLAFRDKFSNFDLRRILCKSHLDFNGEFNSVYELCSNQKPKQERMRTFQDSAKSKKTIASITQPTPAAATPAPAKPAKQVPVENVPPQLPVAAPKPNIMAKLGSRSGGGDSKVVKKAKKDPAETGKKGKAARQWELKGSNPDEFDFSKKPADSGNSTTNTASINKNIAASALTLEEVENNLEITDSEGDEDGEEENASEEVASKSYFGSIFKNITNRTLNQEVLKPILDQLRDHLIRKNVAAEVAIEICESVGARLEGQHVNTWVNLKKYARDALEEAIMRILNPIQNINILREIQAKDKPPYVIVFCGVNGVGKSTNLAKIANWLMNNKVKVLVVACDTFRSGAIEQLKTHVMALKSIHERGKNAPVKIELFEKGYGKDSAGVAATAINYARANKFDCVMVDTAGRMQDNEPLMKELAKLIKTNSPDLTLFVGEALVGNEAVDQLTKFNNSLLDNGCRLQDSVRSAINGIVLTKFDTIDDQVGAAISMTHVTSKPIVFVGVGQTYRDLKQLDARAVTKALMR